MIIQIENIEGGIDESIITFAKECIEDTRFADAGFKIDPGIFSDTLQIFANDPEKVFFIARVDGKAVGVFLGEIRNYPFTNVRIAVELYFRVSDEYRGKGIFTHLLKYYEDWARNKGCKFSVCGVNIFSSHGHAAAAGILERDDYQYFGSEYFKEL